MHKWFGLSFSVFSFLLLLLQTCTEVMYFVHDGEFSFSRCFRRFLSVCDVNRFSPRLMGSVRRFPYFWWSFTPPDTQSESVFHVDIQRSQICHKRIFVFPLDKNFHGLFYINFLFKKKMQRHISSLCVCKGHLHFFHFVSLGVTEHVGWVKNGWILSFFHAKKHTHEFWENPRLLWLSTISKSQVCYWC